MSSLKRYKKSGGFIQLLSLIEGFAPQKKEKFLEMIHAESPVWAEALREKCLSVERIFGWPSEVLIEVFKQLPLKNQALVLHGSSEENKKKVGAYLSVSDQRRIGETVAETIPRPEDVSAAMLKMIELARRLLLDKFLHPEKFDASLTILEGIENHLEEKAAAQPGAGSGAGGASSGGSFVEQSPEETPAPPLQFPSGGGGGGAGAGHASASGGGGPDVGQLQRTLAAFAKENKGLKDELKVLREKLEQIRRIA